MDLEETYKRWDGKCVYCGVAVQLNPSKQRTPTKATRDHFFPRATGGRSIACNLVLACHTCNVKKGDIDPRRIVDLWMAIDAPGFKRYVLQRIEPGDYVATLPAPPAGAEN